MERLAKTNVALIRSMEQDDSGLSQTGQLVPQILDDDIMLAGV